MAKIGSFFSRLSIFGVIFGQKLGFWPPGVPIYRVSLNCYAVDYEDIASRLKLNVFFGNYMYSNGPNLEDFNILIVFDLFWPQKFFFLAPISRK